MIVEQRNARWWFTLNGLTRQAMARRAPGFGPPKIVLTEHPRSGGTWVGQMLAYCLNVPNPRNRLPPRRRCLVHGHFLQVSPANDIVVVWRDGRDVMVSYYYYALFQQPTTRAGWSAGHRKRLGIEDAADVQRYLPRFIDYCFADGPPRNMSWTQFVETWRGRGGLLETRYEALRENASRELRKLLQALSVHEVDEEAVADCVSRFSFQNVTGRQPGQEDPTDFCRKGVVGDWKEKFTQEAREVFDHHAGQALIDLGYEQDRAWVDGAQRRDAAPVAGVPGRSVAGALVAAPSRRRFLLAGPLPPPEHGPSLSFETLSQALRGRGHDCQVVDVSSQRDFPPSRVTTTRVLESFVSLARFVGGLGAGRRRVYFTLSQSRAGFLRDLAMIWSAWLCRCRIVVHLRGGNYDGFYRSQPPFWRFLVRHALRRVHRIVILSERLRGMYDFEPALAGRLEVVMNGPPEPLQGRPRVLRQGGGPARLLFLSNLIQSKGYDDVLEALSILRKTTALPWEAVFAGRFLASNDDAQPRTPAAAEAAFEQRVRAAGLEEIARWVGPVTGAEKWRLFETSDFFLLPTNYAHEGQPVSIIEAMAHGCVTIATNYRAIPDLVVDGVTGRLVEWGRPEQIAAAVADLAADPARYAAMSRAAVERYEALFNLERHLAALIPLLEGD